VRVDDNGGIKLVFRDLSFGIPGENELTPVATKIICARGNLARRVRGVWCSTGRFGGFQ